ncbi:large ribosomal subunit protein mL46-like isoform X1 [Macrobrachium nipponense]|uniref:large ribosomal subunit protein mL46-like isoform X1 n=2 Tax=Macrobrachium nipponense TaxID=159736 RepID=UPI0030C7F11F
MQTSRSLRCLLGILRTRSVGVKDALRFTCPSGQLKFSSVAVDAETPSLVSEGLGKWQIVGAACITRLPVICPPMTPIEEEYSKLITKLEIDHSLKSNHELRLEQDVIRTELLKSSDLDDADLEESSQQTALEYEDACVEELKTFNFAPRVTEADQTGNLQTLNRALDRALVLLVKQKLGDEYQWVFPQSPWIPGETLRQTCERIIKEKCGTNLKVKVLGNAPCGFYKYKYPKQLRSEGFIGAKVFFYKAQVTGVTGEVQPGSDIAEHQWLTHNQLDGKLKSSYAKSVAMFLVSDQ